MATGLGTSSYCGAKVQGSGSTSYRTPVAVTNATDCNIIPFLSENITQSFARITPEYLDGSAAPKAERKGPKAVSGTLDVQMVYDQAESTNKGFGVDFLLALATQCGLDSSTYDSLYNRYTFRNDQAYSATIAFDKQVGHWELAGAKVASFRISGNAAADVRGSFDLRGYDLRSENTWGSGDAAQSHDLDALRTAFGANDEPKVIAWHDLDFRIGDQSNVLDADDKTNLSAFDLSIDCGLSDDQYATIDNTTHTDDEKPLEHERGGRRSTALTLTVPRYVTDNWDDWHEDGTKLQAYFTFTDGTSKFLIRIPNMVVTSVGFPTSGPGLIEGSIGLACYALDSSTVYQYTGKFNDNSQELVDENSMNTEIAFETLNERQNETNDPFSITA